MFLYYWNKIYKIYIFNFVVKYLNIKKELKLLILLLFLLIFKCIFELFFGLFFHSVRANVLQHTWNGSQLPVCTCLYLCVRVTRVCACARVCAAFGRYVWLKTLCFPTGGRGSWYLSMTQTGNWWWALGAMFTVRICGVCVWNNFYFKHSNFIVLWIPLLKWFEVMFAYILTTKNAKEGADVGSWPADSLMVRLFVFFVSVNVSFNLEASAQASLSSGSRMWTHIYVHAQSERYILNELIQLQDSGRGCKWNGKFVIDWTPVGTRVIHTFILINTDFSTELCRFLMINYFVCLLNLRGSWTMSYKTETTLCLFQLFTEDRKGGRKDWQL